MKAVIMGDIISSRKVEDHSFWLTPLKELLDQWGRPMEAWEIIWGDSFQLLLDQPNVALRAVLQIKSRIKSLALLSSEAKVLDVRLAIGIGRQTYSGARVTESNGPVFVNAANAFSRLKSENVTLAQQTPWPEVDDEYNRYYRLAGTFMDTWSPGSAELIYHSLMHPQGTQTQWAADLQISQSNVSRRWTRSHAQHVFELEKTFCDRIKSQL